MKRMISLLLVAVLLIALASCAGPTATRGQTVVNFLNWGDYIDPDVIPAFERENPDIKINMTTVDSNEAMYAIVSTEGSKIHMMIPSEYMIQRLMKENLLAELDIEQVENYKYVQEFTKENAGYDPEGRYSLPYSWGTFGILYNTTMVDDAVEDWSILFDEKYAGQILMYDSIRDSMGVGLIKLGYSLNATDEEQINEAADLLIEQKPLVMAYGTDDLRMSMVSGSAALSVMYAGDAAYSMEDNPDLAYVVPESGANIFVDAMCIMANAKGATYDAALKFIDYMLRPDVAAKNAEYTGYSTPEPEALRYVDEELKQNDAFNPVDVNLDNCEYYVHLERDILKLYEKAWLRIKVAHK